VSVEHGSECCVIVCVLIGAWWFVAQQTSRLSTETVGINGFNIAPNNASLLLRGFCYLKGAQSGGMV